MVIVESFATRILRSYDAALLARPIAVKAATGGSLAFLGDLNAQALEVLGRNRRRRIDEQCTQPDAVLHFDKRRSAALTSMSTFWTGPVNHMWYNKLELAFPQVGGGLRSVVAKTALSQLFANPFLYLPTFYVWTGAILGRSLDETLIKARREYWPVLQACWIVLGSSNLIMFSFVPTAYQATFQAVAVFCYNTVLSLLSNTDRSVRRQGAGSANSIKEVGD